MEYDLYKTSRKYELSNPSHHSVCHWSCRCLNMQSCSNLTVKGMWEEGYSPFHISVLEFLLLSASKEVYLRGLTRQTLAPFLNSDPWIGKDSTLCLKTGLLLAAWLLACILRWPENERHKVKGPWRDDILRRLLPNRSDLFKCRLASPAMSLFPPSARLLMAFCPQSNCAYWPQICPIIMVQAVLKVFLNGQSECPGAFLKTGPSYQSCGHVKAIHCRCTVCLQTSCSLFLCLDIVQPSSGMIMAAMDKTADELLINTHR